MIEADGLSVCRAVSVGDAVKPGLERLSQGSSSAGTARYVQQCCTSLPPLPASAGLQPAGEAPGAAVTVPSAAWMSPECHLLSLTSLGLAETMLVRRPWVFLARYLQQEV